MGLPGREKAVSTQYTIVSDRQKDREADGHWPMANNALCLPVYFAKFGRYMPNDVGVRVPKFGSPEDPPLGAGEHVWSLVTFPSPTWITLPNLVFLGQVVWQIGTSRNWERIECAVEIE